MIDTDALIRETRAYHTRMGLILDALESKGAAVHLCSAERATLDMLTGEAHRLEMFVSGGAVGPAEAATLTGISESTLRRWRDEGRRGLRYLKRNGRYYYRLTDLARYLDGKKNER